MSAGSGSIAKAEVVRLTLGPLETNCYLVADRLSGQAVVIDPGDEHWRIQHSLAMHEWSLTGVLVTHAHFDHIAACGMLAESAQCTIALHPADLPLWWIHGGAELFGVTIPDQPEPQRKLKDGDTISFGKLELEVLHLPGHTPGHVGFYLRAMNWLFSGDVLFSDGNHGRTDLIGGDEPIIVETVAKILRMPEKTILYPGHGQKTTVGEIKKIRAH
jgi:glyoxylase-like metal-dependent hydrolase (beta-lactamase superfamily II)